MESIIPPSGPNVGFQNVPGTSTTTNFTFAEAGRYRVTWLPHTSNVDNRQPQDGPLLLQQVAGTVTTTLTTMTSPGHVDIVLPLGGATMNFKNSGNLAIKAVYLSQLSTVG